MRISICINTSWNIHNFRTGLIKALIQDGHEVIAIAPDRHYQQALENLGCAFRKIPMQNKGGNPLKDLQIYRSLAALYRHEQIDVALHFTVKPNIYGALAAWRAGVPAINNVTGLGTVFLWTNLTTIIAVQLYRFAFRFPHMVFFQNADDRDLFLKKKIVRPEITALLPGSGIDLARFVPSPKPIDKADFTFLMIGRALYDKGILEYIEAIRIIKGQFPQIKFQLLGAIETESGLGVTAGEVEGWQSDGLITYLGMVGDVRPVIAEADCVVLPSYREGTPRTLIEACAMAKPIIATDVPGCKETVREGFNGFLCLPKNGADLAEKILHLYSLPIDQLQEMGLKSRLHAVKRFDEQMVIDQYRKAIDSASSR